MKPFPTYAQRFRRRGTLSDKETDEQWKNRVISELESHGRQLRRQRERMEDTDRILDKMLREPEAKRVMQKKGIVNFNDSSQLIRMGNEIFESIIKEIGRPIDSSAVKPPEQCPECKMFQYFIDKLKGKKEEELQYKETERLYKAHRAAKHAVNG